MRLQNPLLLLLALASLSCRPSKPTPAFGGGSEHFYQHRWVLVELENQPVPNPPAGSEAAQLAFSTPDRVTGSTGCNRLNGTFTLTGQEQIAFSPLATTRRACPNAAAETRFVQAMNRVNRYRIDDEELMLYAGTTLVARFRAKPMN